MKGLGDYLLADYIDVKPDKKQRWRNGMLGLHKENVGTGIIMDGMPMHISLAMVLAGHSKNFWNEEREFNGIGIA